MENYRLKYTGSTIAFQEVPGETSIVITVSGCPYKCKGCHSPYLWEDVGEILHDDLLNILEPYTGLATCVCFMGGDHELEELTELVAMCRARGFKTCLYTGRDSYEELNGLEYVLNYVKTGRYVEELGGLKSKTTNQRFYKREQAWLTDITHVFHK